MLAAALAALGDYVETQRQAGTGTFAIFDGGNQVGQGTIGVGSGVAAVMSAVGGA